MDQDTLMDNVVLQLFARVAFVVNPNFYEGQYQISPQSTTSIINIWLLLQLWRTALFHSKSATEDSRQLEQLWVLQ